MSIRFRYIVALTLIACLVTLSFFSMTGLFSSQRNDAEVINIAGQQRMLSQRIALISAHPSFCDSSASTQQMLASTLDTFISNHTRLTQLTSLPKQVEQLYFSPGNLDTEVKQYIQQAQSRLTQVNCMQPTSPFTLDQVSNLLAKLNEVVYQFELHAKRRVDKVANIELFLWLGTLVLLLLEATFIFSPMRKAIESTIASLKQSHLEAKTAMDEAKAASQAKSDFLSSMSHELRTPMNGLFGMIELALDTPEKSESYLKKAKAAGRQLLSLINDILDLSKIEAGKIKVEKSPVDLLQLMDDVVTIQRLYCVNKGLAFNYYKSATLPHIIEGDSTRIAQILHNLLSNAIKFTESGAVSLAVNETHIDDKPAIVFTVTDTGIGIADEKLSAIFQKFEQADQSTTRLYGGTGLGLSIAKRLAVLMEGDISVSSTLGKGSEFTVSLPLIEANLPPLEVNEVAALRCAVVDDLQTSREYLQHVLTAMAIQPTTFASADAFLDDHPEQFDLLIVDLAMPNKSGVDLLREMAHLNISPFPRVMLISAELELLDCEQEIRRLIWKTHAKPINRRELEADLTKLINNDTPDNTAQRSKAQKMRVLIAEDNDINSEIVKAMLEAEGFKTLHVKDGEQAVAACSKHKFDFILMDCNMPVMDGIMASNIIRNELKVSTPIAALTANVFPEDKEECLKAGMNDFLTKPLNKGALLASIRLHTQSDVG